MKKFINSSLKIALGIFVGSVAVGGVSAAIYSINTEIIQKPLTVTKKWPSKNFAILQRPDVKADLSTRWDSGSAYYLFSIKAKSFEGKESKGWFGMRLVFLDSDGFKITTHDVRADSFQEVTDNKGGFLENNVGKPLKSDL